MTLEEQFNELFKPIPALQQRVAALENLVAELIEWRDCMGAPAPSSPLHITPSFTCGCFLIASTSHTTRYYCPTHTDRRDV